VKRSDVISAVSTLSRDLARYPEAAEIAATLAKTLGEAVSLTTVTAGLATLVKEGKVEQVGQGYRVSTVDRRQVTIGPVAVQAESVQRTSAVSVPAPVAVEDDDPFRAPADPGRITLAEAVDAARGIREREEGGRLSVDEIEAIEEDVTHVQLADRMAAPEIAPINQSFTITADDDHRRRATMPVGRWQITVIRAVMALSGTGASVVSGYFAIARLGEFMPRALATILGAFIVAFAVIAFELVLVFVQRRSFFAAATFVFLWALVAVFTLNATIAGFYTYYTAVKHEAAAREAPENANTQALQSLGSDEADLRARIDTLTLDLRANERTVQNTTGSAMERSDNGRIFYDAQARITSDSKALDALDSRLQVVREKKVAILAATPAVSAAVKRTDYFEWAGGLLHWQPATMELVSAIFPSVFIDLISSIGLAVALFLQSERKREV
jgi:hypothetical protein